LWRRDLVRDRLIHHSDKGPNTPRCGSPNASDRSNLVTMMLDPAFRLLSAAYAITFPLMVIALVALYWREAQEAGACGAVAFCIAVTGTVALAGDMWFEGFASPWIARVTPEMFRTSPAAGSPTVLALQRGVYYLTRLG
jgi:hypothetical protein